MTGSTRLAGIIGDPVRHSLSPALHNAAYELLGIDLVYLAFEVPGGGAAEALEAARTLGLVGLSVTMPHKEAVADLVDVLTPTAARLGSVNTVLLRDQGTEGDSTDGAGFLASLVDEGVDPDGMSAVVIGAGGAARAVVAALADAGASVTVGARRIEAADAVAAVAGAGVADLDSLSDVVATADLVVNATPIGMAAHRGLPPGTEAVHAGQVVVDLVYHPATTALLDRATEVGAHPVGGLGMLVHQAALQVGRFTGRIGAMDDIVGVMMGAARAALGPAT